MKKPPGEGRRGRERMLTAIDWVNIAKIIGCLILIGIELYYIWDMLRRH